MSAVPETDTLTDSDGNEFKLDSPFGDELPENGFVPDLKGYLAPLEDGSAVEVNINPSSDRLQFLERFEAWDGNDSMKNRVLGMIGSFRIPSATDKMRVLVDKGVITDDQYSDWKKLRNPIAHSYLSTGIPTPDMIQLLQSCEVLFYHLVFRVIGYEGPYVEYSTLGWPLKEYPGGSLWK